MERHERFALLLIAACVLLAGWLDGQDAAQAEQYAASVTGQQLACVRCQP